MDFYELQSRLREVEVDIEDGTLRRWAANKLISGPKRDPKPGRQGAKWEWPKKAVEEAAAVWALRHLKSDRFYSAPSLDTIKRVKFEAMVSHKDFKNDIISSFQTLGQKSFDPQGQAGSYLGGYDLHPFIVTWIAAIEKVRHKKSVREPVKVIFNWSQHVVHENGNESFQLKYDGVIFEPSDEDHVMVHVDNSLKVEEMLRARKSTDPKK
jgi:hypothetical protein